MPTKYRTLIDSGCSLRAFCDRRLVTHLGIDTQPTPYLRTLLGDGQESKSKVDQFFIAPIQIGNHLEDCLFFVTDLEDGIPIISLVSLGSRNIIQLLTVKI